jgi:hypothetical protein
VAKTASGLSGGAAQITPQTSAISGLHVMPAFMQSTAFVFHNALPLMPFG